MTTVRNYNELIWPQKSETKSHQRKKKTFTNQVTTETLKLLLMALYVLTLDVLVSLYLILFILLLKDENAL